MRRAIASLLGFVALLALGVGAYLFLSPPSPEPAVLPHLSEPGGEPEVAAGPRRSVLEKAAVPAPRPQASAAATDDDAKRRRSRFAMERSTVAPALSGLETQAVGAADAERLRVPDDYGSGVIITRVHPDAPAAEAGLRPGDVIIRAMRENVSSTTDLERVVGQRPHTVLIAVRDGQPVQLVIQKPYDGS